MFPLACTSISCSQPTLIGFYKIEILAKHATDVPRGFDRCLLLTAIVEGLKVYQNS